MANRSFTIPYSDDLLVATGKSPEALEQELRFLLAVKLFELRRLSLGKAAQFSGMIGGAAVMVVMRLVIVPVITAKARSAMVRGSSRPGSTSRQPSAFMGPTSAEPDAADVDAGQLLALYATRTIIGCAMLEGPRFSR